VNPLSRDDDEENGDDDRGGGGPVRNQRRGREFRDKTPYSRPARYEDERNGGADGAWSHDKFSGGAGREEIRLGGGARVVPEGKVLVTNLDPTVTSDDVEGIFEKFGVSKVNLFYDSNGRSQGSAEVTFQSASGATQAVKEYDGAEVDGKPMHLKVIGELIESAPRSIVKKPRGPPARSGKAAFFGSARDDDYYEEERSPRPRRGRGGRGRGSGRGGRDRDGGSGGERRGRGGRGRGRGGRGGGGERGSKKDVSAADLDAEMDSYQQSRSKGEAAADGAGAGSAGQPPAAKA